MASRFLDDLFQFDRLAEGKREHVSAVGDQNTPNKESDDNIT